MFHTQRPHSIFCLTVVSVIVLVTFPSTYAQVTLTDVSTENSTCEDLSVGDCCNETDNLNCSLCQADGGVQQCRTECVAGETDTCSAEPSTTTVPTTTNSTDFPTTTANTTEPATTGNTTPNSTEPATTGSTSPNSTESTTQPTNAPAAGGGGSGQTFDGASFVGGIILSFGIVAIVFFGLKFYRARTEQNYHTL